MAATPNVARVAMGGRSAAYGSGAAWLNTAMARA